MHQVKQINNIIDMKKTKNGIVYDILSELEINQYNYTDRITAQTHINNVGVIIIDQYHQLINNNVILDEIYEDIKINNLVQKYSDQEINDLSEPLKNQIDILLTKEQFPIAYKAKYEELIKNGYTDELATRFLATTPIRLDVYYSTEKDYNGLFAVESEIVECAAVYNPYTQSPLKEYN